MLTALPLAGRTSIALSSSLKISTALVCLPFESGTLTRLKEVSSAKPRETARKDKTRTRIILFTVLKVYRSGVCVSSTKINPSTAKPMALRESEAIVLRSYPLREADLLVSLFTRAEGKVRGVARSAKKSKRRFGGALEPLTYVRAFYDVRERQELARLDSCEVLESPMSSEVSYPRAVALGHIAELLDELLPDHEANDAIFRLTLSVLHVLTGPEVWMPVTYFELWLTRLVGFLPELTECAVCGRNLNGSRAYFPALAG